MFPWQTNETECDFNELAVQSGVGNDTIALFPLMIWEEMSHPPHLASACLWPRDGVPRTQKLRTTKSKKKNHNVSLVKTTGCRSYYSSQCVPRMIYSLTLCLDSHHNVSLVKTSRHNMTLRGWLTGREEPIICLRHLSQQAWQCVNRMTLSNPCIYS